MFHHAPNTKINNETQQFSSYTLKNFNALYLSSSATNWAPVQAQHTL